MTRVRKLAIVAFGGAALVLASGSTAWAHECYNASRSDQGNIGADHSPVWYTVVVRDFARTGEPFPAQYADCFLANWFAAGGPESFTTFIGDTGNGRDIILGAGNGVPDRVLVDGHGIDHIAPSYQALANASLAPCLAG